MILAERQAEISFHIYKNFLQKLNRNLSQIFSSFILFIILSQVIKMNFKNEQMFYFSIMKKNSFSYFSQNKISFFQPKEICKIWD